MVNWKVLGLTCIRDISKRFDNENNRYRKNHSGIYVLRRIDFGRLRFGSLRYLVIHLHSSVQIAMQYSRVFTWFQLRPLSPWSTSWIVVTKPHRHAAISLPGYQIGIGCSANEMSSCKDFVEHLSVRKKWWRHNVLVFNDLCPRESNKSKTK